MVNFCRENSKRVGNMMMIMMKIRGSRNTDVAVSGCHISVKSSGLLGDMNRNGPIKALISTTTLACLSYMHFLCR